MSIETLNHILLEFLRSFVQILSVDFKKLCFLQQVVLQFSYRQEVFFILFKNLGEISNFIEDFFHQMMRHYQALIDVQSMLFFFQLNLMQFSGQSKLLSIGLLKLKKRLILCYVFVYLRNDKTRGPVVLIVLILKTQWVWILEIDGYSDVGDLSHCIKIAALIIFFFVKNHTKVITVECRGRGEIFVSNKIGLHVLGMVSMGIMGHEYNCKSFKWNKVSVFHSFEGILRITWQ